MSATQKDLDELNVRPTLDDVERVVGKWNGTLGPARMICDAEPGSPFPATTLELRSTSYVIAKFAAYVDEFVERERAREKAEREAEKGTKHEQAGH